MSLEHLEHDGHEDFGEYETRGPLKDISPVVDPTEEEEKDLEQLQKEWMDFNNPALWDGEI